MTINSSMSSTELPGSQAGLGTYRIDSQASTTPDSSSPNATTAERLSGEMTTEDRLMRTPSPISLRAHAAAEGALENVDRDSAQATDQSQKEDNISSPYLQLAMAPSAKFTLNTQPQGGSKGFFSSGVVDEISDYITGNAIARGISGFLPEGWVLGKDCIKLHNGIIKDVLFKDKVMQLGTKIIGQGSTHDKLQEMGMASDLKSFSFLTEKGGPARGNATAHSLKNSVGQYIANNYRGKGVQVYGISFNDGYHSITLTHGKNKDGEMEYHLIDNGGATSRITGHKVFKTAKELDNTLNEYAVYEHTRDYRVGKNKDMEIPARVDVYEIYSENNKQ